MEFKFEDYIDACGKSGGVYVMSCETEDEIDLFSRMLDDDGRKWQTGERYTNLKYDVSHGFVFNQGACVSKPYTDREVFTVLRFSDFNNSSKAVYENNDTAAYEDQHGSVEDVISFFMNK